MSCKIERTRENFGLQLAPHCYSGKLTPSKSHYHVFSYALTGIHGYKFSLEQRDIFLWILKSYSLSAT